MPAPQANLNAARNGGRLTRLTLGNLPVTMRKQMTQARQYRRALRGRRCTVRDSRRWDCRCDQTTVHVAGCRPEPCHCLDLVRVIACTEVYYETTAFGSTVTKRC